MLFGIKLKKLVISVEVTDRQLAQIPLTANWQFISLPKAAFSGAGCFIP